MLTAKFLNLLSRQVWAIDAGYVRGVMAAMPELIGILKARHAGEAKERPAAGPPVAAVEAKGLVKSKIGVLKMSGPIVKGVSEEEAYWYGLCSVDKVHSAAAQVQAEGINHLILHLDSPGGMVCGIAEAAERLADLRTSGVTLTAYTDTLACSAAYWLAAACDEIIAAPSAMVGSIGCICLCLDNSGLYEKLGLKPEYFVNEGSEAKLFGRSGLPWSDEARASFQESVDLVGAEFKAHISERRPGITDADMNGDAWDAGTAPAGYVDHTHANGRPISTLGDLLSILTL